MLEAAVVWWSIEAADAAYGSIRESLTASICRLLHPRNRTKPQGRIKRRRPRRHAANFLSPATHVSLTLMSAIVSGLTL